MPVPPVAFVDCETTGLDPDRHEIWEVGLILPDGSERSWQLPVDLGRADPMALNIGRFHKRRGADVIGADVADWDGILGRTLTGDTNEGFVVPADHLREWAATFVDVTRGLHLAGAVVSFDAERLWKLLRANGECPMWHYHLVDVEALAVGYLNGTKSILRPAGMPWASDVVSRALGVEPDDFDRHTALGDARWAKAIYEAVMQ